MIGYSELGILFLLLLAGGKKKEGHEEVRTSPPGAKVTPGDVIAPAPRDEPAPAPRPSPGPQPEAGPGPGPAPTVSQPAPTALTTSAQNMLNTLAQRMNDGSGRGAYRVEDMDVYKAFQRAARVTSDGMPGKGTMDRLKGVLSTMGLSLPDGLPIYPWKTASGFHHPNAPEMREWNPAGVAAPSPRPVPTPSPGISTPPQTVQVGPPAPPTSKTNYTPPAQILSTSSGGDPAGAAAISMAYAVVKRYGDGSGHGPYRKTDMPWYSAFQKLAMGSAKPDGFPGAKTMAALALTVSKLGVTLPFDLPMFPFKKFDAPGDIRSVDWNAPTNPNIS